MTGYTVHTGSTVKFSQGWDKIFGGVPKSPAGAKSRGKKPATPATKKQAPPKGRKKAR